MAHKYKAIPSGFQVGAVSKVLDSPYALPAGLQALVTTKHCYLADYVERQLHTVPGSVFTKQQVEPIWNEPLSFIDIGGIFKLAGGIQPLSFIRRSGSTPFLLPKLYLVCGFCVPPIPAIPGKPNPLYARLAADARLSMPRVMVFGETSRGVVMRSTKFIEPLAKGCTCLGDSPTMGRLYNAVKFEEFLPAIAELKAEYFRSSFLGGRSTNIARWACISSIYLKAEDKLSPEWKDKFNDAAVWFTVAGQHSLKPIVEEVEYKCRELAKIV